MLLTKYSPGCSIMENDEIEFEENPNELSERTTTHLYVNCLLLPAIIIIYSYLLDAIYIVRFSCSASLLCVFAFCLDSKNRSIIVACHGPSIKTA